MHTLNLIISLGCFSLWTVSFFSVYFKNETTKHGARAICSMPAVSFERIVSVRTMRDAIRCRCSGRILSKYVRSIEQHGTHSMNIRYWMHTHTKHNTDDGRVSFLLLYGSIFECVYVRIGSNDWNEKHKHSNIWQRQCCWFQCVSGGECS